MVLMRFSINFIAFLFICICVFAFICGIICSICYLIWVAHIYIKVRMRYRDDSENDNELFL
jgi:hypothetical protein